MQHNIKIISLLLGTSMLAILSACNLQNVRPEAELVQNSSIDQTNPRANLVLASEDLVGDIRLSNPVFQAIGALTRAQVTVQNLTENRYTLEYKFDWADNQGFAVNSLSSWHRFTLSPRQALKFTSTGKVPEATTITFTTRLPDDVFIHYNRDEDNNQSDSYID